MTIDRSKIVVTSRRPLPNAWVDPRVRFVAVDFLDPVEKINATLKDVCGDVTHAFFTSYVHSDDFRLLRDKNVPLFRNFLNSVDSVCLKLQRVCLQTGGKVSSPRCESQSHSSNEVYTVLRSSSRPCKSPTGGVFPQIRRQRVQFLLQPRGLPA